MLLLPAVQTLFAQKKVYTLEEIWQKVVQYPTVASKEALVHQQEVLKKLVQQQSLPEMHVQAQQSYGTYTSVPGSFFPLPGTYNTSGNKPGNETGTGSNIYGSAFLQWNFLQFGRQQKQVPVAESRIKLGQAVVSQEVFRLQSLSTRYYFAALESEALLKRMTADAKRLADLLDLQKAQADAGLRPGADTLLIKAVYLDAISKIYNQQASLESVLQLLAALTGEEAGRFGVNTSVYDRFNEPNKLAGSDINNHPYLQYLTERINYHNAELEAVRKEPYPSVGLLAGTGIRGSGIDGNGLVDKRLTAPWHNTVSNYLVGVGITWKFSMLYNNKAKRKAAIHQLEAAKSDYEGTKRQIDAAYASAIASWKEQRFKMQNARLALQASQQAYDLYTVRYESGLLSLIELLQLQKSLQEAEINYVRSVSTYWNSLIEQSEALGDPTLLLTAIKR